MNEPRTIPYAFRVVEIDGLVWLYDDSERTYICSQIPMVYCEALGAVDSDDESYYPDADYFAASEVTRHPWREVPVTLGVDVTHDEAWDVAREEATANSLL
jgi:hypothetical protein